jgi:nitrous oxide reductase accessory protein NosL
MMKKFAPFIVLFMFTVVIVVIFLSLASSKKMIVVKDGNLERLPIEMEIGIYQDSDCGMVIDDTKDASQVIAKNGRSWFFHDHGGFVKWLEDKEFRDSAKIWVMSRDTKRWIDAREAFYSLTDETPMGYGFGAYEKRREEFVDFDTMRLRVLRGETLRNLIIRKQLLGK